MLRSVAFAALATAFVGFALPTAAADPTPVKDVNVSVDLAALKNEKAAARYAHIADDLKGAIMARIADRVAKEGSEIYVTLDEVSLANSLEAATGMEQSTLVGKVHVRNEKDGSREQTYDLTVGFKDAGGYIPAGTDLTTLTMDSDVYYKAMVDTFADRVVAELK